MDSRKPLGHMQRLEVQVKGITGHRIIRSEEEHIFHTSSQVNIRNGYLERSGHTAFHP